MSRAGRKWIIGAIATAGLIAGVLAIVHHARQAGKPYIDGPVVVIPGKLYRCNDPSQFQENQIAKLGIKSVINTRVPGDRPDLLAEGKRRAEQAGAIFINMPIGDVVPSDDQIEQFLRIVRDGPHPALIHCEFGRSRTGMLVASYRIVVENWPVQRALDEMVSFGYRTDEKFASDHKALLERLAVNRSAWLAKLNSASQPASAPAGRN